MILSSATDFSGSCLTLPAQNYLAIQEYRVISTHLHTESNWQYLFENSLLSKVVEARVNEDFKSANFCTMLIPPFGK